MNRRLTLLLAGIAAFAVPTTTAVAQPGSVVPGLTLSFLQPTDSGDIYSSFDIWLRLALDPNASALAIDGSSPSTKFGMPGLVMPTTGSDNMGAQGNFVFDSYSFGVTSLALECSGSFSCGSPEWDFNFHVCQTAQPCFNDLSTFSLAPGGFYDYLFGTFSPRNGSVPPGTYNVFHAYATMSIAAVGHEVDDQGNTVLDAFGDPVVHNLYDWTPIANTCANQDPTCEFSRTVVPSVVATPEPATMSLVALGLLGIVGVRRRRAA